MKINLEKLSRICSALALCGLASGCPDSDHSLGTTRDLNDGAVGTDTEDAGNPGGSDSGSGAIDLGGTVTPVGDGIPPSSAKVVVIWTSDVGQGDYLYKYGEGPATATSFSISIDGPVPTEATFGGVVGVGLPVLIPSSVSVPDGVVTDPNFGADILGLAGQYAIVFRGNAAPTGLWVDQFPVGLSCGQCVPATTGFDAFTPMPCNQMIMQVGPRTAITVCNWS
jgi:hypothetical protein